MVDRNVFTPWQRRENNIPRTIQAARAPTSADHNARLGDFWIDTANKQVYILSGKTTSAGAWDCLTGGGGGYDYQESVLKQCAIGSATATEGNRYLCNSTGGGWTADYIYEYKAGAWEGVAPSEGMVVFDEETAGYLLYASAAWGSFTTGITTIAAATDTNIATPSTGQVLIYDGSNSWDNKSLAGDVTVIADGTTSIGTGVIINTDVNASAAIAWSKMAALTDANILIGSAGNVATVTPVTGDVAITNGGVTTVTGITLGSDAQGDIYYRGASALARLGAGSAGQALVTAGAAANPYWGSPTVANATSLANSVTCEAGASDYTLAFGTAGGAYTLTIPAVGGARTFSFINEAEAFSAAKTFANTALHIVDSGGTNDIIIQPNETNAADRTLFVKVNDANRTVDLTGNLTLGASLTTATDAITLTATAGGSSVTLPASGTVATLAGTEELTNKTVTSGVLKTQATLQQTTANYTLTWADPAVARAIAIPDPGGDYNFVFDQSTQSLSGKTLTAQKIVTTDGIFDGGGDEYVIFTESATPVNYLGIHSADTLNMPVVAAEGSDADIGLMLYGKGTGKVTIADAATPTKMLNFELVGATATKTMQILSSHTDDRTLTLPDATDTLIGKATTDTLTNKSYDCDGTGNVLTNVNVAELDADTIPAADGNNVTIMDGLIVCKLNNHNGWVDIYNANAPYAFLVIDAWSINQSADGGSWKLNNGAAGAGTDITDSVTVAASDQDIDRPGQINDAAWNIAASGSLSLYGDATVDCMVFIRICRLA